MESEYGDGIEKKGIQKKKNAACGREKNFLSEDFRGLFTVTTRHWVGCRYTWSAAQRRVRTVKIFTALTRR